MDEWYSYGAFKFTRNQCMWAISLKYIFEEGIWPPNPMESSYTEAPLVKRQIKAEGYFVKPIVIIADINKRLKRTKTDGKLLVAEINAGLELDDLSEEARRALNYISGSSRKQSYREWKKQREYRNKK